MAAPGSPATEMKARRREKLTLDALSDLMVHLAGVREERKALVVVTEGWQLFRPNPNLTRQETIATACDRRTCCAGHRGPRPPTPAPVPTAWQRARGVRGAIVIALGRASTTRSACERSRRTPTGATSRSIPSTREAWSHSTLRSVPIARPRLSEDASNLRVKQDGLRFLADNTDGTSLINTNNIDGGLQRIVDDLSSYYLFGYYSTNTKLDGRFRNITVRVKRPGVRVRARRGYRGRTADELISGAAGAPASEAPDALTAALTPVVGFNARSQFRIRTSSWARQETGGEPRRRLLGRGGAGLPNAT